MNLIVAVDKNYGIGNNNDLLFNLKQDMQFFKEKTINKVVVMGDKTLLSFPNSKPLKNRTNIVLTSDKNFNVDGATVVRSLEELFAELCKYDSNDIYIIGGAFVYNTMLPYCNTAFVTKINSEKPADRNIIKIEELPNWYLKNQSETFNENGIDFCFCTYENAFPLTFNYISVINFDKIETERLIIRKLEEKDIDDWYEMVSDTEVTKFMMFPAYTDKNQLKERYNFVQDNYKKNRFHDYFIELKENHKVIGTIGIVKYIKKAHGQVEIGYLSNKDFWKNGYMTEALHAMIKYIFENTTINRICLKHDTANIASGKVMQKNNMFFEGITRETSDTNYSDNSNTACYSILRSEYFNNKNN